MNARAGRPLGWRWLGLGAALAAAALIAGACGSDSSSDSVTVDTPEVDEGAPTEAPPEATASEGEPTAQDEIPAVEVAGGDEPLFVYNGVAVLGAEELTLAEVFEQGKPVVMNFWAGLCPPCRQEMPDFQEVYNDRSDEFVMLGVDVGPFTGLGDADDALALLDELGVTYPTARVDTDTLLREYDVFGMPATVFLAADGSVVSQKNGLISLTEFSERVQDMIDASG